jgi:hypothetical protein
MSSRLQRLYVDVEIALHERAARLRRRVLRTAIHEDMPGHPERIRDIDPESQDEFDHLVMAILDERLFHLLMRTGWAR